MRARWSVIAALVALGGCVDPDAARPPFDALAATGGDARGPDALAPDGEADAASGDATAPSDGDGGEEPVPLATEHAAVLTLQDRPARGLVAVADALLVAGDNASWWWVDAAGATLVDASLDPEMTHAVPSAAVALDEGPSLVAAGGRLALIADGALTATPLADAFAGRAVVTLCRADGAIWIATDQDLSRLADGSLATIAPAGLPTADARLVWGPPVDGTAALWVSAGGQVYALTADEAGALVAWPEQPALAAVALGADASGRLWVLSADGAVYRRSPDAVWGEVALPEPPTRLVGTADAPHVWLPTPSGRLIHAAGDALSEVVDPPPLGVAQATDRAGRLLVAGSAGVFQVAPGRVLSLRGLPDGAVVAGPLQVEVVASSPAEVRALRAAVDGSEVDVAATGDGDARRWWVTVTASALDNGVHTLAVDAEWDAGDALQETVTFRVAFPTWAGDVEPLYRARCAACHDALNGASTAVLDAPAAWRSRIDCIVCRVHNPFDPSLPECLACHDAASSMPPTGPITPPEVELIRTWRDGGFR